MREYVQLVAWPALLVDVVVAFALLFAHVQDAVGQLALVEEGKCGKLF